MSSGSSTGDSGYMGGVSTGTREPAGGRPGTTPAGTLVPAPGLGAGADALTADGAIVAIRPVTTADAEALTDLFHRSSAASLRLRFFATPGASVLAAEVARLTRPPSPDHAALVAVLAGDVVGVASFERWEPTDRGEPADSAEFALFVADEHQGRGIGTLLLEYLAGLARGYGITRLYGEVLADNARMLQVAGGVAATATSRLDEGTVEVVLTTEVDERTLAEIDSRDRAAERASLRPLFAPRSVAVVGAGRRAGGVGHEVFRALRDGGFTGPVYPVNPHATTIAGAPAYPSLRALPDQVELVVVAVPAGQVRQVLADAGAAGARAAVILTAGFSEAPGQPSQRELVRVARSHGIRLVGPNCLGIINTDPAVRLNASFAPQVPPRGGLAIGSQSGAVGIALLDHAARHGCGVSHFVSLGNKADVSGNDLIAYWYDDPATSAALLYLESFGNPRKFARVARALARRKPLLAVFSGRTAAGRRAGASHTAAATAPDVAVDTLFGQAGVVRAENLGELIDAARMLADQPLPGGDRLAVVGNAGGVNVMVADAAEAAGLRLPATVAGLDNPLDLGAAVTPEELRRALSTLAESGEADTVLVVTAVTRANDPPGLRAAVAEVAQAHPRLPLAVVMLGPADTSAIGDRRVPVYDLPERAVRAIVHATGYAAWRREPLGSRPDLKDVDRDAARAVVADAGEGWQPYPRVAAILRAYGIPLLASRTAGSAEAAVAAADQLGYPVVVKAADPQVTHKSDLGAVRLDLADAAAVRRAYRAVAAAVGQAEPTVLVQPMASGTVELVAGIVNDPLFGSLVMAGLGGVHTDLFADRAFRLVPVTDLDAGRMWRSLRVAPLLTGYRGAPPVDTAAVEDLLLRLGRLAEELPEVAELDLNPVLAGPDGVVCVDAKLRLAAISPGPDPVLRRLR